jgi:hypothetical protein
MTISLYHHMSLVVEENEPIALDDGQRWQVAKEDVAYFCVFDKRQFDTEADHHGQDQASNKVLKSLESF